MNDNPLVSESLVLGIQKDDDDETYINAQILPNIEAITEYLKGAVPTKDEIKKIIYHHYYQFLYYHHNV